MNALYALFAVVGLVLLVFLGVSAVGLQVVFGVIVPYAAVSVFLIGVVYRVLKWATIPVPFRITTVCGQQKSLPLDQVQSPRESAECDYDGSENGAGDPNVSFAVPEHEY